VAQKIWQMIVSLLQFMSAVCCSSKYCTEWQFIFVYCVGGPKQ